MAEVDSFNSLQQANGTKLSAGFHNAVRTARIRMPATYAAVSVNDTIRTGVILPRGAMVKAVTVRNGAGTASSTIDIGLRSARTGTPIAATGLGAAHAITAASGGAAVTSGTLLAAGASPVVSEDAEIYLTAKGATLAANQALEVLVDYTAP